MKLDSLTLEYLNGKKFSNSHTIDYNFLAPIPDRVKFVCDIAKDKSVLHLGCLDHLPLIDAKMKRGQWLHKELTNVTKECLGVDIDEETLNFVHNNYGFKNIVLGDFTKTRLPEIANKKWDYAILGELLEHIDNPVEYLQAIKNNYSECIEKIIVTVPNAWTQTTISKAARSKEIINTDHRYWFTPYTLSKVITQAGMQIEELFFTNRVPLTTPQLITKKILNLIGSEPKYNFTFASSIVAIARLKTI